MGEYLFLGSAILSLANGTALLCVNPRRVVNRVFFATAIWAALCAFCVAMAIREGKQHGTDSTDALFFWLRLTAALAGFLGWLLWLMQAALLDKKPSVRSALKRTWPWFMAACAAAALAFSESYIPSTSTQINKERGIGYIIYFWGVVIACTVLLLDSVRHARNLRGIRKIEMQFFVLGLAGTYLLATLTSAMGHIFQVSWLRRIGPIWFIAFYSIVVWAVCYHRVFEAKQLIASFGQRLALVSILGLAVVPLTQIFDSSVYSPLGFFLATATVSLLAVILDQPTRKWIGLDPGQKFLETRRRIIDWARKLPEEEKLRDLFEKLLCDYCHTESASLLLTINVREGMTPLYRDGWITPETLQRVKGNEETVKCGAYLSENNFGALLAVPKGSPTPSLIVALGQKHSLRPYTFPDIRLLLELAELMDNILTHSRAAAHTAQIERMETAAIISRGLAHDLSNLATPVSTFLIHMETRVAAGTPEDAVLSDAKHSIEVMQRYIQESLFFTRALSLNTESIETNRLLPSVARVCHERARSQGVNIVVDTDPSFIFSADLALMQRLLQNLIFNAIDASTNGGEVKIAAVNSRSGNISFVVVDQGAGIGPEILERIFEPYFTTKKSGSTLRGLGLGLAICRKIVDLHNGEISVVCGAPLGTTFRISLPVSPGHAANETGGTSPTGCAINRIGEQRQPTRNFDPQFLDL